MGFNSVFKGLMARGLRFMNQTHYVPNFRQQESDQLLLRLFLWSILRCCEYIKLSNERWIGIIWTESIGADWRYYM